MKGNKGGRPSVALKIKELSGTIRKDRIKEGIESDLITIVPKPEVWLDSKAKNYFKNMCELLIKLHLLNEANIPLVAIMAQEFATYELACRELKDKKKYIKESKTTGVEHQSPWVGIRNQAQKNYKEIASLFGLDPLSAQKIAPIDKADKDPFEEMVNKYSDD